MTQRTLFALSLVLGLSLGALALLLGLPALVGAQEPLNNTFTYQGRLRQNGAYLEAAACDLQFELYDAPAGGSQVGIAQTVSGVTVSDGYFNVLLNTGNEFGADAFSGDKRYLQVVVKCGADTAYTPMDQRVSVNAVPYALYAPNALNTGTYHWNDVTGKPPGFADDVDNVVTYTAGFGLDLSGNQFSVITSPIVGSLSTDVYQERVDSSCTGLQAIQGINADGSVQCGAAPRTYQAGEGLLLNGNEFSIDDTIVQRRITQSCDSGYAIRQVSQDGSVECELIPQGTITEVVAGAGLTGGGSAGEVTLQVSTGGITTSMLATAAISTSHLQSGAIVGSKIGSNQIDSSKILTGAISFIDLAENGCSGEGKVLKWKTGSSSWTCEEDTAITYQAGPGLTLNGDELSVNPGTGVMVSGTSPDDSIAIDFAGTGGDMGTASTLARSDHDHGSQYIRPSTTLPSGDVSGKYEGGTGGGFTVQYIQNEPIASTTPGDGDVLLYTGSQWEPSAYGFPINLEAGTDIRIRTDRHQDGDDGGTAYVYCGSSEVLLAGGCQCDGNNDLEDSDSTGGSGWFCSCNNDSNVTVYAICLRKHFE